MGAEKQKTVAVIGSGLAGLVTAYLLHNDPEGRYKVTVFEKWEELGFSFHSFSTRSRGDGKAIRADVPMRAFAGGFYRNLMRLYDFLGIRYHPQQFLFHFTSLPEGPISGEERISPRMVHASNFHQLPPRPAGLDPFTWILEGVYLTLCFLWFALCCFLVQPYERTESRACETLGQYLRRIQLPRYYVMNYLLPLMSSMATCSHSDLVNFPARDIIEYKKRTHFQPHYVVEGCVATAEERLAKGLDVRLGITVAEIATAPGGVQVSWKETASREESMTTETFDLAVLAASPDVVASIFPVLKSAMTQIPTVTVPTQVHSDDSFLPTALSSMDQSKTRTAGNSVQNLYLRSSSGETEAIHEFGAAALITTNQLTPIGPTSGIKRALLTRVVRTPASRQVINSIFHGRTCPLGNSTLNGDSWRNGDGGVYLVGGWCWDGLVLLEGCLVSSMRVATDLGVSIPWGS